MSTTAEQFATVPIYLCQNARIIDDTTSATSKLQLATVEECLPLLRASQDPTSDPFDFDENGMPPLDRSSHISFIQNGIEPLPAAFVALDASRPWLMYWSLLSLYLLGEDITQYAKRYEKSEFNEYYAQRSGFANITS